MEKPGVIATIVQVLKDNYEAGGVSVNGILAVLCERFPERERESMKVTVNDTIHRQLEKRGYQVTSHKSTVSGVTRYRIDPSVTPDRPYTGAGRAVGTPRENLPTPPEHNTPEEKRVGISEEAVTALTTVRNRLTAAEGNIITLETRLAETTEALNNAKEQAEKAERLAQAGIKRIVVKISNKPPVVVEGKHHPKLSHVLRLVNTRPDPSCPSRRMNVLLIGPAGSGKTYLAEQVAKSLELDFGYITCTAGMSEGQLLGKLLPVEPSPKEVHRRYVRLVKAGLPAEAAAVACTTGAFRHITAEFVKAYENGGVYLLDEVDASDQNTIMILNTALESSRLAVPSRPEKPYATRHEDFICIAAANTFGNGADRQYVGRNQLDAAFLNRFQMGQVVMDYDEALEMYLCPDEALRERLQAYRNNCTKKRIRRIISSRTLRDAYAVKMNGVSDQQIDEAIFGGWTDDEVTKAKEGVKIASDDDDEDDPNQDMDTPAPLPEDGERPKCPVHHIEMVRMGSNKGWRCAIAGNRYLGNGCWSMCGQAVFDKKRR